MNENVKNAVVGYVVAPLAAYAVVVAYSKTVNYASKRFAQRNAK